MKKRTRARELALQTLLLAPELGQFLAFLRIHRRKLTTQATSAKEEGGSYKGRGAL